VTAFLVLISCTFFLVSVAICGYFLVVLPRRWREPLTEAIFLLDNDGPADLERADLERPDLERADLERAERLLADALNAGPRGAALSQARFAQAFVQAMLGQYDQNRYSAAAATLNELTGHGHDEATAYLDLWLHSRMDNHDQVCDLWEKHENLLADRPHSRFIAAAAHLHLAVGHWRRHEVDGALHYFDTVRSLGELAEHVPPGVDDLQLVRGIQAALDRRRDDARNAFAGARDRAAALGTPATAAELGLLACDWPDGDPAELGSRLHVLAGQLADHPHRDAETELLATAVALLRLIALVREWLGRPRLAGAPAGPDLADFRGRVDAVRTIDQDLGDSFLIEGLIGYYFALGEDERERALTTLEHGTGTAYAIMVPEVRDLVERERALGGEGDAISRYRALIAGFLADPARSDAQRAELREIASRFARFGDPADLPADLEPQDLTPDMTRLRSADMLRRRIQLIVFPRVRDRAPDDPAVLKLTGQLTELDKASDTFSAKVRELHETEQNLIVQAGQVLLPEEER
jgi:hypothetical protein